MNSREYWEKRAARRMYEDMKTAEDAADDIEKLYGRASSYIQQQGSQIFEKFRRETGLTEQEAIRLLQHVNPPTDIDAVLDYVNQIKDPAKRQAVIDWLRASSAQSRLARLASLQKAIDNMVPLLYAEELKLHQRAYKKIIQNAYLHKVFDIQQFAGYGQQVAPLDAKQIDKLMRERWLGSNYSSRLWGNTNRLAKALRDELTVSFFTGRPQLETWRAINAEFGKGQHASRRLVRTESCYMHNQVQLEAYKQAGIEKYIYVATLDLRTSRICRELDGKTFEVSKAQAGLNYPPMHPWCRSTTIAWMPDKLLARMKRDALDPKTGKHIKVPANMTYAEWHSKFVAKKNKYVKGDKTDTGDIKNQCVDITADWKAEEPFDEPDVTDADKYIAPDGTEYIVDGHNVVLDYKPSEKAVAEIVSKEKGARVEMQPRVNSPEGINTPDCKIDGEPYEIKCSIGSGNNAIINSVKRGKKQAGNIILDISKSPLSDTNIDEQVKRTMSSEQTRFIKQLVIVKNGEVIKVLEK